MENENEFNDESENINAEPVIIPQTPRERMIRCLSSQYTAAFDAATLAGEWENITKAKVPSAALELFCITASSPADKKEAAIVMLKRVKRHLIRLNLTVLEAYERRMLADAIFHCNYQDENFGVWVNREFPQSGEPGWEDRVEAAQARLDAFNSEKECEELPEAV